jgi:hypothetical protein
MGQVDPSCAWAVHIEAAINGEALAVEFGISYSLNDNAYSKVCFHQKSEEFNQQYLNLACLLLKYRNFLKNGIAKYMKTCHFENV